MIQLSPRRVELILSSLRLAVPTLLIFTLGAFSGVFSGAHLAAQDNIELANLFGDGENGGRLFSKQWQVQTQSKKTDPDGLGPLFNASSCLKCHHLGGPGGAGTNLSNVQLMSVLPRKLKTGKFDLSGSAVETMFEQSKNVHPQLRETNAVVLHRFSAEPGYDLWQQEVVDFKRKAFWDDKRAALEFEKYQQRVLRFIPVVRVGKGARNKRITVQISHRNTPSLFGTGLIEKIPDEAIRELAEQQAKTKGPIKGKVAELPNGTVGRFGWRGQESSLANFTIQACSVELGLQNTIGQAPSAPKAKDDFQRVLSPAARKALKDQKENEVAVSEPDVTAAEIRDMVLFIANLPAPKEKTFYGEEAFEVAAGAEVFQNIGCATCHVKSVGHVDGVYSDFLMHEMGTELADVAGVINRQNNSQAIGGYFGPSISVGRSFAIGNDRVWQTPPLWGIANSGPYMHDGRARDFESAIRLHGGEAAESRRKYGLLSKGRKSKLLKFLGSLGE